MDPASETPASIAFGRFRVVPHRRELLADGRPIKLGGRAFDVLMALIEARGAVVGKDALMARVWPDRVIEENNLQAQVSALRRAFGAERDLIRTVAGRGYQFSGEIRIPSENADEWAGAGMAGPLAVPSPTNLPEPVSELIGRDDELRELLGLAAAHRLVTLTGPGGIGKTRLALAAAHRMLRQFPDGVWLAEFSPLADPGLVPATVAAAIGLELGAGAVSAQRVARALADRRLLLVLDTCEHLIDAAAAMAETLLRASSTVRIIATSREPLNAEGEQIYLVPPLAVPASPGGDVWQCGAVLLFVVRSRAGGAQLSEDRHAATIAAICRRLDGIPLAIELAAARAPVLGLAELAVRLEDRFQLLTGGRRTALPRHQTLRATLDWSFGLLAERERVVFRRLAIFAGAFSLTAAGAVAMSPEISSLEVIEVLSDLVAKSLVAAEFEGPIGRYRLLDTTRAYALEKLGESGEKERLARRHAEYYRGVFERAEAEWEVRPAAEWLNDYGRRIDNLRAALDWAFSPSGDPSIGVALTAAAVPLWMHLSLIEECRACVERALAALARRDDRDRRREMQLSEALGAALMYTRGAAPETRAAFERAFEIGESLEDTDYRLRALWGLWVDRMNDGAVRDATRLAEQFSLLASNSADPIAVPIGDRMLGFALHFLGEQADARRRIERMFTGHVPDLHDRPIVRFQFDPWLTARMRLAVILWLQGFPDQARRTVESSTADALSMNHPVTLCNALAQGACPIALLTGDLDAAERYVKMLLHYAERSGLGFWLIDARCFEGVLAIRRGEVARGSDILRNALDASGVVSHTRYDAFLGELAEALGALGDAACGLAALDRALDRTARTGGSWYIAELHRIRGELLLLERAHSAASKAEDHFRHACDCARRQGALSWELRAATSLARLLHEDGRAPEGAALLQPVYDRFTEGFDTVDLQAARALLDTVAASQALPVGTGRIGVGRL